ncbi:serine/arginine repetitive matrix protein 5 isoform X2 [Uranotaenia lowii]|uniref:serine/arginine repetitive matrix protein 5 isoform X2 n=1 Tax=Uranotaenia lowii TaxID=190385 RepID=UPI00247965BC|nr:serine/arginine repetitive matrix protein 5 isoform X2 [Uranotaenia lowii]
MALRLRKDVQKASYYVWFLGAQEAKGLRGSRVLLPVIPRLIEKSKEREPLKVTLQISHKGLKIIQGSAKHFIPHGAITCSVQAEDVVACILLLYNPATKCPLHVHAYRCDSEATAQAMNEQLQILINRAENQKRFAELETRLGLSAQLTTSVVTGAPERKHHHQHQQKVHQHHQLQQHQQQHHQQMPRRFDSPRRIDSSHGSDTGTSTRESECSEEQQHSPTSPISPILSQSKLYDSLAAELREKLSGGVPLLLPAKDYDKSNNGNDSKSRNPCIVGPLTSVVGNANIGSSNHNNHNNSNINGKQGVSSRGSSGIGSDLAPSPERQEAQSSSEDEWVNEQEVPYTRSTHQVPPVNGRSKAHYEEEPMARNNKYRDPPSTYLYPNVRQESRSRFQRSSSREEDQSLRGSVNSREEEVKPVINKSNPMRNRFRDAFHGDEFIEETRKKKITIEDQEDGRRRNVHPERYQENIPDESSGFRKPHNGGKYYDGYDNDRYHENLTDRQKYREMVSETGNHCDDSPKRMSAYRDGFREYSPERVIKTKYSPSFDDHREFRIEREFREHPRSSSNNRERHRAARDESLEDRYRGGFNDRRPYREPEERVSRDLVDSNGKNPNPRHKPAGNSKHSNDRYDDRWEREPMYPEDCEPEEKYRDDLPRYREEAKKSPVMKKIEARNKSIEIKTSSPESTIRKVSPKDRFQNAKEKFQQMERERYEQERIERERQEREHMMQAKRATEAPRRSSLEPVVVSSHESNGWSTEDEVDDFPARVPPRSTHSGGYRELEPNDRYPGLDREPIPSRIVPAKSLGNLNKGYRHSYAEPRPPPVSRSSGRVGLAAVNPY